MSGPTPARLVELSRRIEAREDQLADDLSTIGALVQQWADYRRVMRDNTAVFVEAGREMGPSNYFVQKALAARQELDGFVGQLADGFEELLEDTARELRSLSEEELEQLRKERAGVSWG